MSERRACRLAGQHRSTQRHAPVVAHDDAALRTALRRISRERPRWGYRRAHALLCADGWVLNIKRTRRVWREEGLRVPRKRRKRQRLGESTVPATRLRAERPDHVWAIDFQWDQTADGHNLKLLHVVDEFTREALAIECHRRIDSDKTVSVLASTPVRRWAALQDQGHRPGAGRAPGTSFRGLRSRTASSRPIGCRSPTELSGSSTSHKSARTTPSRWSP
jgi:putative transposase